MTYQKIVLSMVILLYIFTMAALAEESGKGVPGDSTEGTVVGTIQSEEAQGNNYLELTLKASNNKTIHILCSGQKTQVFSEATSVYWVELKPGRRIKVVGNWITEEGRKLLWARRIDLL